MGNMSSFTKQNNCNILSSSPNSEGRSCNFRNKDNCPLAITELKLSNKMKHMNIMEHLIESSSIGTTVTQIPFGTKIMKTKLNSENILAVKT